MRKIPRCAQLNEPFRFQLEASKTGSKRRKPVGGHWARDRLGARVSACQVVECWIASAARPRIGASAMCWRWTDTESDWCSLTALTRLARCLLAWTSRWRRRREAKQRSVLFFSLSSSSSPAVAAASVYVCIPKHMDRADAQLEPVFSQ